MKIEKVLSKHFENALFILHDDTDGIGGCEVLARLFMPEKNIDFKSINANGGDFAIQKAINSKEYDLIVMGDCSFKLNESLELVQKFISDGNQFFLIDHHKNAMEYSKYNWSFVSVSENDIPNSGTELMYQFLKQQIPYCNYCASSTDEFVELVRSYDTWDWFKTNNTQAVDLVKLFEFNKESFADEMLEIINSGSEIINEKQKNKLEIINQMDENYSNKIVDLVEFAEFEGKKVAILVSSQMQGLIGNKVFEKYPDISFVLFIKSASILSLRSTDDREDVYSIVSRAGGGGHRNAAGCGISDKMIKSIFKSIKKKNIFDKLLDFILKK